MFAGQLGVGCLVLGGGEGQFNQINNEYVKSGVTHSKSP